VADQTLTADSNFDSASILGLANGENITLAGFSLTCDSDTRWGQQAAVFGNINPSATLGGDVLWDSTRVWWMAYDAPSGNVPALGTAGVQNCTGATSGATGEFLGIWGSIPGAPVAAAAAIPATGWIKFRSKVGTFQDNEVITLPGGATITANSATGGQRGWLHFVGEAGSSCAAVRLGSVNATGDWFELGITDGTDDQTFAIPVLDHVPIIWVETGVGSGVYEKWVNPGFRWGNSVQMVPTDIRGKMFGQWKEVTGTSTSGNGIVTMTDTAGFLVGMPVGSPANALGHVADGAVITAIVPNTSVTLSKNATQSGAFTFRSPLGTITIARRATNACGFKPAAGLRVRVPNAWMSTADSASWTGNQNWFISATSKWEITAAGGGIVVFDKVNCLWYHNTSGAYQWEMRNCGVPGNAGIQSGNTTLPLIFDDNGGGGDCPQTASILNLNILVDGSSIQRNCLTRINNRAVADRIMTSSDGAGVTFNDNVFTMFGGEGSIERAFGDNRMIEVSRWTDSTMDGNTFIGGTVLINTMLRCSVNDHTYADKMNGATTSTNPLIAIVIQTQSVDCEIKNISLLSGLSNVHPYFQLVFIQTGCLGIKVRDIGTIAAPLNMGSANACGYAVNLATCSDCQLNRIYTTTARLNVFNSNNATTRLVCDNVWGGAASDYIVRQVDSVCRGMYGTPSSTGAQSVYGSHWTDAFNSPTTGLVRLYMNEPTADSADQLAVTSGVPAFTAGGQLSMPTVGDQIVATMPYFAIGHTSLANIAPVLSGTLTANMSFEFQYDFGSGWNGTWLTLDATNLSGAGAISPTTGFKLRIRVTVVTADPTNALTGIRIDTVTDATSQQEVYPYQYTGAGTMPAFVAGSRVQIYNVTTSTEIYNESQAGTSLIYQYYTGTGISDGDTVRVRIARAGYLPFEGFAVASISGFGVIGSQVVDSIYVGNGIDGSAVTEFTPDYPNIQIDINDPDNTTSLQRFYAWAKYNESLAIGIEVFFNAVTADNALAYTIHNDIADIYLDNVKTAGLKITGGWLYRDDGAIPVAATSTGPIYFESGIRLVTANAPSPWAVVSQNGRNYGAEHRDMYAVLVGATAGRGSPAEVFKDPTGAGRVTSNNDGTNRTSVVVSGS
jgi:hypothetical protein